MLQNMDLDPGFLPNKRLRWDASVRTMTATTKASMVIIVPIG